MSDHQSPTHRVQEAGNSEDARFYTNAQAALLPRAKLEGSAVREFTNSPEGRDEKRHILELVKQAGLREQFNRELMLLCRTNGSLTVNADLQTYCQAALNACK